MTCEIQRPAPQELFDRYRNMFQNDVLGGAQIIPESNEWYVVALNYAVAEEFYSIAEQQWKERDPRFACCDNLTAMAALDGVFPRAATGAEGYGTITGTPGAALPSTLEMTMNGKTYRAVSTLPSVMPASGSITVRFRANDVGADTSGQSSVTTGTLNGTLTGINKTVTIANGNFCGGRDAETCEAFRSRYLARKQYKPVATDAWIREKLLEWPCVTRVCQRGGTCCTLDDECGCASCNRRLDYYVFMDDTFDCGIVPSCVAEEIETWMFGDPKGYGLGQVPVGICGNIYTATAVTLDIFVSTATTCISNAQQAAIKTGLTEFFKTLCPSTVVNGKQIAAIVINAGITDEFDVDITVRAPAIKNTDYTDLGDCCGVELLCDRMPCLGNVTFDETLNTLCVDPT